MLTLIVVCSVVSGCAPARFSEGVTLAAEQAGVGDASASPVQGMEHLRFDTALRDDLDGALAEPQMEPARESAERILHDAHRLAVNSAHSEIERMPPAAVRKLADQYAVTSTNVLDIDELRAALVRRFDAESAGALATDLDRVAQAQTPAQLHKFLDHIRKRIEPKAGDAGRLARVLLAAPMYVPAAIGAERADKDAIERPTVAEFKLARVYNPQTPAVTATAQELESADFATLAQRFAPILVQEVNPSAEYDSREDCIGKTFLTGDQSDVHVQIDVSDPVVYWTHTQAKVRDRHYDQLIYVAWYPSRPALSPGDPQAGDIDGVVVRMTLDRRHRPAIYEFVRTCGCYHTLWVADFVENAARAEVGVPLPGMAYAVQKHPERSRELFMPALVEDDGAKALRPVVTVDAGQHLVVTIDLDATGHFAQAAQPPATYRLEPYEMLTRLPLGQGIASMFNGEGLVHDAARPEGWMLAPTGMLQAGRPRQLGTMKIRMDAYDYDDPHLLERNLRLPSSF